MKKQDNQAKLPFMQKIADIGRRRMVMLWAGLILNGTIMLSSCSKNEQNSQTEQNKDAQTTTQSIEFDSARYTDYLQQEFLSSRGTADTDTIRTPYAPKSDVEQKTTNDKDERGQERLKAQENVKKVKEAEALDSASLEKKYDMWIGDDGTVYFNMRKKATAEKAFNEGISGFVLLARQMNGINGTISQEEINANAHFNLGEHDKDIWNVKHLLHQNANGDKLIAIRLVDISQNPEAMNEIMNKFEPPSEEYTVVNHNGLENYLKQNSDSTKKREMLNQGHMKKIENLSRAKTFDERMRIAREVREYCNRNGANEKQVRELSLFVVENVIMTDSSGKASLISQSTDSCAQYLVEAWEAARRFPQVQIDVTTMIVDLKLYPEIGKSQPLIDAVDKYYQIISEIEKKDKDGSSLFRRWDKEKEWVERAMRNAYKKTA